jgi:hypothetical protein
MAAIVNTLISLSSAIVALWIGFFAYKKLSIFYQLLFFQVLVYVILDCISVPFMPHNSWIINLLVPVETALLFTAAHSYFNTSKSKYVLLGIYILFFAVYLLDIGCLTGVNNFAFHASIAEGVLATGIFISVLYFQLDQGMNAFNSWPITFICLGMVLYFAGSIPYLSTLFYFNRKDPVLNLKLFHNIIGLLAHVRYIGLALGFYLAAKGGNKIINLN